MLKHMARYAVSTLFMLATGAASAQQQRLTIIVGFSTGGVYDSTGRLIARHMGRHLPANPTIIVQNMPGSGSMVAANHLYNVAPRDGSALAVINGALTFEPLFGNPAAKYDPRQLAWIGGRSTETALCVAWHAAKLNTIQQARSREVVIGSIGPGSRTYNHPKALNELLGTKFKIVNGYPGGAEITLAMERGEVEGWCGWAWGAIKSRSADWVRDKKMILLVQTGVERLKDLRDIPFAMDLVDNPRDRDVMEMLFTDTQLAWPLVGPPGMKADKVASLRRAFADVMMDPVLLKDAEAQQLEIAPVDGAVMQESVQKMFRLPDEIVNRAKAIIR